MKKLNIKIVSLLLITIFLISTSVLYQHQKESTINEAQKRMDIFMKKWKALFDYVEIDQKNSIYKLQESGVLDKDYFDPHILSFTFIARNVQNIYEQMELKNNITPYYYSLAATNPRNPANKASKEEALILEKFRKNEIKNYSEITTKNKKRFFTSYTPLDRTNKSCMKCHSDPNIAPKDLVDLYGSVAGFGEKVGDIRAMIILEIPIDEIEKETFNNFILTLTVILSIFIGFFIFIYILYKKDIKLQNEREKRLVHQNKLASMGEMIGNIAHQWRQPLNSLNINLENLEYDYEDGVIDKEFVNKFIKQQTDTLHFMNKTIDDFRNFFKIDKEKISFRIKEAIEKSVNIQSAYLKDHDITLNITGEDFNTKGIESEFQQVIMNLISNAKDAIIEAGQKNGKIEISLIDNKVIVTDNGGGIPDDIIERIFDSYYTTKEQDKGTGVGLYMSKMIIEESMGGKISVANIDGGVSFTIVLVPE